MVKDEIGEDDQVKRLPIRWQLLHKRADAVTPDIALNIHTADGVCGHVGGYVMP
jgi:hypothetical protein